MIRVVIDKSGSMNTLGKPEVIQSIIRELQLTDGINCEFFIWDENIKAISYSSEYIKINFGGKSSISALLDFIKQSKDECLLLTDGFSNDDKADLSSFLRDNPDSKLRIVLVGADSRISFGKTFFPENLIATEQKKYIFNSLEVSTAIESFNF